MICIKNQIDKYDFEFYEKIQVNDFDIISKTITKIIKDHTLSEDVGTFNYKSNLGYILIVKVCHTLDGNRQIQTIINNSFAIYSFDEERWSYNSRGKW
jgi:hypothetical protein